MRVPAFLILAIGTLAAQVPNPTQQARPLMPADTGQPMPIFRVTVVSRTTKAINYHHRTGSTKVDFRGTELMPAARGEAKVESRMGSTKIETDLDRMSPASQYGPEYLTYVLWAITPEGRATNLGEVVLDGDHSKLLSTTELQSFGLIVTAEPYFAVTQPSDVVVAENFIRNDTSGTIQQVDAKYELLQRGQYVLNRAQYEAVKIDRKGPLQLAEAQNAVEIARIAGADRYAADTFNKALIGLRNAEDFLQRSKDRKRSETNAREAAQMAEDARIITFRKIREEQLAAERAAAAQREVEAAQREAAAQAQARAAADQARLEQERRAQAEADRLAAERARRDAEAASAEATRLKSQAEAEAGRIRAEAEADRAAALAQQQSAQADADRARLAAQQADQLRLLAEQGRQKAENDKAQLRERLRQQLNLILETRESARGLIVNISDVLFDFNKYTLKPGAREKMAKVAGILLAYPGLKIQVEGHTDSVGSEEYNNRLSEQRAAAVRDYLAAQSVPSANITAVGFGKSRPVASNETAAGRQQNRRVELVVSGEPIGIETQTESLLNQR
jgi:outer membrane protein OmpA-like peptidoglycan-associated protein